MFSLSLCFCCFVYFFHLLFCFCCCFVRLSLEGEEWIENDDDEEDEGDDLEDGVGQEDASIGDVLGDDLELPPIDEEENGDLDDAVEVEENEDEDDDEFLDDYQDF
ncbi:hypothetical protein QL285_000267 [Trifolium repens]|nr:hypothetical protein QL285_000267 [Trifolium repens]